MYAVIMISGRQFWVEKNKYYDINHINLPENSKIKINRVLLLKNNEELLFGKPFLENTIIKATILSHLRGTKIFVYKKKRKKKYKKMFGHRQFLTRIKIDSIVFNKIL
jgi:large subunit ribosomal protein L21